MATSASPFAAIHQTDGAASSTAQGRGGSFRGAKTFQPRGGAPFAGRDGNNNGTGFRARGHRRGTTPTARASRGNARGAGATSNTWRANKPNALVNPSPSPFAQLKENQPGATPVYAPAPQQKPSFSGFGRGSSKPGFAAPATRGGTTVNTRKIPRQQPAVKPTNAAPGGVVPVEDAATLSGYNDRYEKLKIDRAKQRGQAIKDGQMADPNQPMSLNKAITPVGTCTSMCPEFERVERIVQKMVDKSEKYLHPKTNSLQNMEAKMLKRFRRSAAGYDEQLPSDIRTPATLLQTMNYLTRHIIGGPEPLGIIHKFVWDRTRSIRNDFSVQQLTQEEDVKIAVTCLERIARFHIVSLHLLSSPANEEPFDRHQEREQLNNTMLSLMYYYDDNRDRIAFPNEDEFRAYYIIFSIHDQRPDLEARVQKWPTELRNAPRVRVALEMFAAAGNTWEYQGTLDAKRPNAIAQGFYARFFNLVNSPGVSYLMACVAEIYFNHMRQTAIRSIWKGYCRYPSSQQHKNEEWTVDELTSVLCFDDDEQTIEFCTTQDLEFAENANREMYLTWGSRPVDSVAFQPSSDHSFSDNYVEIKRAGRSLVAVVLGLNIKEAASLGMVDRSLLSERTSEGMNGHMAIDNDDSLFVSEDENEVSAPFSQSAGVINELNNEPPSTTGFTATGFGGFSPSTGGVNDNNNSQPSTNGFSSTGFGGFSQLTPASQGPASFPPKPAETQPAIAPNPFGSLSSFSNSIGSAAPSSPSFNPSATSFTPSPNLAPETSQPAPSSTTPANNEQSPSLFSNKGLFPQPSQDKASDASVANPFKLSTTSEPQPSTFQASPFNPFPNASNPTPSATSPFGAPSTFSTPFSAMNSQPSAPTAGQSSSSILDAAKPAPPPEPRAPLFSAVTPESTTQKPQTTASEAPKLQAPAETPNLFSINNSAAPEKTEATPLFSLVQEQPQQWPATSETPVSAPTFGTVSKSPSPTQTAPVANGEAWKPAPAPQVPALFASDSSTVQLVAPPTPVLQHAQLPFPAQSLPVVRQEVPEVVTEVDTASEERAAAEAERVEAERQLAWITSLREAADRRRNITSTPTSRKRVLEQETPPKNPVKAPKVPKAARPNKSLALSSVKPLPKLPILEQIEKMTARKPTEQKPEPPKPNNVDEDELLLSAARIAAESMRTGPRLLDGLSTPYEPWRSSFSPGSSIDSYSALSRSQSPQQPSANGYDVALAPDNDLGLGRTLSRTEQRIRMTGGKGLAYKPLNLTPKKSCRTSSKK
ncbi:SAC3/GANP/Nin1/mts3/eIF-3 p25 family-domain-containing protein [Aspergillus crustosus]